MRGKKEIRLKRAEGEKLQRLEDKYCDGELSLKDYRKEVKRIQAKKVNM